METVDLLIFDMDGLMFDTGRMAYKAYFRSAQKYNYEMNHNVYYYLTGRTELAILKEMSDLYGSNVPYALWREEMNLNKERIFLEEKRVYKKTGLENLLKFAKNANKKVAVASSNRYENILKYLEIEAVSQYIDYIISGDEVKNGKPNPEIFLTACNKASVSPQNAIVLEDSRVGISAAKSANIRSILIEDDITDLPIRKGKYNLLVDLSKPLNYSAKASFQFEDLNQVIDLFKEYNI